MPLLAQQARGTLRGVVKDELGGLVAGANITLTNANGEPKTADEITRWSDEVEASRPYDNPERRDWFTEQTKPLKLDPAKTTLFDWLDADDKASHSES